MSFQEQLKQFNRMYGFPVADQPHNLGTQRLKDLKDILQKELNEIDDIIRKSELLDTTSKLAGAMDIQETNIVEMAREILVDMADLMIDLQVYCGSETLKWGIPMEAVQYIVMASNASKLGADGKPIINEQGKLEKGPFYWKPEPLIEQLLARSTGATRERQLQIAIDLCAAQESAMRAVAAPAP